VKKSEVAESDFYTDFLMNSTGFFMNGVNFLMNGAAFLEIGGG
jgi:hypothetical protein